MNEENFKIENADLAEMCIRDIATAALFTFIVKDRKLGALVGVNERNPFDQNLRNQARSFAVHEARKRDLID